MTIGTATARSISPLAIQPLDQVDAACWAPAPQRTDSLEREEMGIQDG